MPEGQELLLFTAKRGMVNLFTFSISEKKNETFEDFIALIREKEVL
jgi:hypothetical protein